MFLNKKIDVMNIITSLVAYILTIVIMPFESTIYFFSTLFFMLCITLLSSKVSNKLHKDLRSTGERDFYLSFLINILCFVIFTCIIALLLSIQLQKIISIYTIYFLFFLLLIQNIWFRSPGFMINGLLYKIEQNIDKLKILLKNFISFSWLWLILIHDKFSDLLKNEVYIPLVMISIIFLGINMLSFIFIYKSDSIINKILHLKLVKINQNRE